MAAGGHQYYGGDGAPMEVPGPPERAAAAWRSHRSRLLEWLSALPAGDWAGPTRCDEWCVTDLVQHLISVTKFLNFTLREATEGRPTRLLEGFDPKAGPAAIVANAPKLSAGQLVETLAAADAEVGAQIAALADAGWSLPAEAPQGQVPAYLSLTHMLFDSWVHERDLLLPAGDTPVTDRDEAGIVAAYVFALAGIARAADEAPHPDIALQVRLTDVDAAFTIRRAAGHVRVSAGAVDAPVDAAGTVSDLVGYTTGRRPEGQPVINEAAAAYLTNLVTRMN